MRFKIGDIIEIRKFWFKLMNICFGFVNGWYITPILIGRVIRQVYKD